MEVRPMMSFPVQDERKSGDNLKKDWLAIRELLKNNAPLTLVPASNHTKTEKMMELTWAELQRPAGVSLSFTTVRQAELQRPAGV